MRVGGYEPPRKKIIAWGLYNWKDPKAALDLPLRPAEAGVSSYAEYLRIWQLLFDFSLGGGGEGVICQVELFEVGE